MKREFTKTYKFNLWKGKESVSGPGSSIFQTKTIRQEIPLLVERLNVKTMMDAPCGDFHWMSQVNLPVDLYIGVDIVDELISINDSKYGNSTRKFVSLDITKDTLPQVDLILCRDCLVHLSFADSWLALRNFKRSGSKYLLTTTFPHVKKNRDITTNGTNWRPLNLQLPPYDLPNPLQIIDEKYPFARRNLIKTLGLWDLTKLVI
jgi:hypothetical protein